MRRLLTALSRLLGRLAKQEEIEYNSTGAFFSQRIDELEAYSTEIYDEENDFHITIKYACSCDKPVYHLLGEDFGFGCLHCDSVCLKKDCPECIALFKADYGDPNAEL